MASTPHKLRYSRFGKEAADRKKIENTESHPSIYARMFGIEMGEPELPLPEDSVAFAAELIRIPTVNPPGENYRECAEFLGARLGEWGMDVEYVEAEGRAEHTIAHPRVRS